jgi:hypothetical protein
MIFSLMLTVFGGVAVTFFALHVAKLIYVHFVRPKANLKKYGAGSGYWAGETNSVLPHTCF